MMRKGSGSIVLLAIVMAMMVIPGHFLCAQESQRTSRVLAQVNEQQLVMLRGHLVPWATRDNDLGAAPDSMNLKLIMILKRSDAQESALQTLMAEQLNPKSTNYHKWLTPEEYGTRFGISDADLAMVTSWLKSHGFAADKVAKGSNAIRFSGTHALVQQTLHTQLHQYKVDNETHYANASEPIVPAALAPVISGFYGLNDMKPKPLHTTPRAIRFNKKSRTSQGANNGITPQFTKTVFDPDTGEETTYFDVSPGDWTKIYNVRPISGAHDGTGQTVAIVAESDVYPKDFDDFRAAFGLPQGTLNVIYDGPNPGRTGGSNEIEADLDMEWAGVAAPGAAIDVVVSDNVAHAIMYAVDNDIAPVLSVSWGLCEFELGASGNAYFEEVYKQAASQGITVISSSGDEGSSCDRYYYATHGLAVSGMTSTPYNVSVGGTDFPVNVLGNATQYWGSENNSDQSSAKSYIPEFPWNESCGSPQVLAAVQQIWGWDWASKPEDVCNQNAFLSTGGGGGGTSNCVDTDTGNPRDCKAGYPQPEWQKGVPGVADDARRHVPDVSFMSGSGQVWASGILFCASTATSSGGCNYITDENGNDDVVALTAGGTSFAAPAFAGVVALLNDKAGSRLGNINYTLYQLAANQFHDETKSGVCQTDGLSDAAPGSENCIFHDIMAGSNAVPCLAGSLDNPPDGVCTPIDSSYQYAVLSGYNAGLGYDSATGLGSVNVANLVSNWPASDALAASQTSLTLATTSLNYGTQLSGTVTVSSAKGTPSGSVAVMYKDAKGHPRAAWGSGDLNNGKANIATSSIPVGTYKVYAHYAGDGTYGASASAEQSVTVSQAQTTVVVTTNHTSVGDLESAQLVATIKSSSFGDYPTGKVVFKNTTTGAVLGTVGISAYTDDSSGLAYARTTLTAGAGALSHGSNQITAMYQGDTNYAGATGSAPAIEYNGGFSITASSSSIALTPGATLGNTVVFTLTPSSHTTLSPSSIQFTCPGTLPVGVACQFSAATTGSNGAVSSTLTLLLTSPLAQNSSAPPVPNRHGLPMYLAIMVVGGLFVPVARKRSARIGVTLAIMVMAGTSFGCGGSSHKTTQERATTTVTLTTANAAPALNSPVTLKAALSNIAATGSVTFYDGTASLGSVPVSNGAASLTTSSLPVGARTITAKYSGDSTYPGATSASVTVDVTFISTITAQAVDTATGNLAQQTVSFTVK